MKAAHLWMMGLVILLGACAQPGAVAPVEADLPVERNQSRASQPELVSPSATAPGGKPVREPTEPTADPRLKLQGTPVEIEFEANENVRRAIADLAERLGIASENIELIASVKSEFTQQAFYCQVVKERVQRDEAPQMLSGETILLRVNTQEYEYHASDQDIVFCRQVR
jgi:hypothetical protein